MAAPKTLLILNPLLSAAPTLATGAGRSRWTTATCVDPCPPLTQGISNSNSLCRFRAAPSSHPPPPPHTLNVGNLQQQHSVPLPGSLEHAVALNNSDVCADYVVKLKAELEGYLGAAFAGAGERERVRR